MVQGKYPTFIFIKEIFVMLDGKEPDSLGIGMRVMASDMAWSLGFIKYS